MNLVTLLNTVFTRLGVISGRQYRVDDLGIVSGVVGVDFSDQDNVTFTLSGDATVTFTAPSTTDAAVGAFRVHVIQDATGGHVITWPGTLNGDLSAIDTSASSEQVILIYFDGTNYHAY